jgi:hypothetical protein
MKKETYQEAPELAGIFRSMKKLSFTKSSS